MMQVQKWKSVEGNEPMRMKLRKHKGQQGYLFAGGRIGYLLKRRLDSDFLVWQGVPGDDMQAALREVK